MFTLYGRDRCFSNPTHDARMIEDFPPLLKNLPPKTSAAMNSAIRICGDKLDRGPDWVRRWIAFTVVGDALAHYGPPGNSLFQFKGGAAIELRLRRFIASTPSASRSSMPQPRATRDLDAAYRGAIEEIEAAVRAALAEPRHNFSFRVVVETPDAPFMRRFTIRVAYQETRLGRMQNTPFSSMQLEVSAYEGMHRLPDMVPAFSLKPFGLEGPDALPCLPLIKQIAQKLHAVTEHLGGDRKNERFRDLVDLVLLSALEPASPVLREACLETFEIRGKQPWPPDILADATWLLPMNKLAAEMGLDITSAEEIVARVRVYVRDIGSAE